VGLERILLDVNCALGCGPGTDFLDGICAVGCGSGTDCVGW
jgi:hypothetical protein